MADGLNSSQLKAMLSEILNEQRAKAGQTQESIRYQMAWTTIKWLCGGGLGIVATCCVLVFNLGAKFENIQNGIERSGQETKLELRMINERINNNSMVIHENKLSINKDILKQVNKLSSDVAVIKAELQKAGKHK